MTNPDNRRQQAYRAGARIARDKMASEAPLDAEALSTVQAADIVVVKGSYDHVELVLEALEMPHTAVAAGQLPEIELRPEQFLVINCPGHLPLVRPIGSPTSLRPAETCSQLIGP